MIRIITFVLFFSSSFCQTVLINEGFEGASIPTGWTVIDNDGDGNQWNVFNQPADAHTGNQFSAVQWNSAGNEDWLITDYTSLPISNDIELSFWAKSLDPSYLEDFVIGISVDGSNWDFPFSESSIAGTYTNFVYDLSSYAGNSVFVAIICTSVDKYYLCIDDFSLIATPNGTAPAAYFSASPTTIIQGNSVAFTDLSTGTPTSWLWDFGDGYTSSLQNPNHVYTNSGTYDVSLTATNTFGSDTYTELNYIIVNPSGGGSPEIQASIGDGWFIEGVTPVMNTLTLINESTNTDYVVFYATESTYTTVYDSYTDNSASGGWSWDCDMGSLPENCIIVGECYDAGNNYLESTPDFPLSILPKPEWLVNGWVSNVYVTTNYINMTGHYPLSSLISNNQVSGVIGLNNKSFSLLNPATSFDIEFDMTNGISVTTMNDISADIGALANNLISISNTTFAGTVSLDSDFNLILDCDAEWEPNPIEKSFEFKNVPLAGINTGILSGGAFCVNTSLNFSFQPKINARLYAGYDNTYNQWGFLQNGTDVSSLTGSITAVASAKGKLTAVCGSILGYNFGFGTIARGEVRGTLLIGGGIEYYNVPSSNTTPIWAGAFDIYAYGEVFGLGSKDGSYSETWGDTSQISKKILNPANNFFSSKTFRVKSNPTPNAWPMGEIASNDSIIAAAWIDNVNFSQNTALLSCYYDPNTNLFSTPIIVAENDSGITNHSIALLPNKDIFVSWSQISIKDSEANSGMYSIDDVNRLQDIWVALIDPVSNTVIYKSKLFDSSGLTPDGEPRIHWGNGSQGMITWQIGDEVNNGSDIYYSIITDGGGVYYLTNPQILNNSWGANYNVKVSYTSGNSAMVAWLNDPDNDHSTINTEIYYNIWDGTDWIFSSPQLRFNISPGICIKDYSLSTNELYGIEGLSYYYYNIDSTLINGVFIGDWIDGDPNSSGYEVLQEEDSTYNYQIPRVTVSKNGVASLTLQIIDFLDPNDYGRLNLFMKDINYFGSFQSMAETSPGSLGFISDPDQFVWDMSCKYGFLQTSNSMDILYLFTQEMDSLGNTNPSHGEIFGNPNLNMVLRAMEVTSNSGVISVTDVPEPSIGNVTSFYQNLKPYSGIFDLGQNYPNPLNDFTTIPFHLYKQANITIEVFDIFGKHVGFVLNGQSLAPGDYLTNFSCPNLSSGIYYYKLTANGNSETKKMIISR